MKLYTGITIFLLIGYILVPASYWGMLELYFYSLGYWSSWLIFIFIYKILLGLSVGHITLSLWLSLK